METRRAAMSAPRAGTSIVGPEDLGKMAIARVTFSIDGKPFGKERPRAYGDRMITPKRTEQEEAYIAQLGRKARADRPIMVGPVRLMVEAVFETPASWPSRPQSMALSGALPHMSAPDLDNIAKLVQDGLNGVVFVDDRQICELVARKRYGTASRVEVVVEELATSSDHPALKRSIQRELDEEREVSTRAERKRASTARRHAPPIKAAPLEKRLK